MAAAIFILSALISLCLRRAAAAVVPARVTASWCVRRAVLRGADAQQRVLALVFGLTWEEIRT
jgi:hypothetical protein